MGNVRKGEVVTPLLLCRANCFGRSRAMHALPPHGQVRMGRAGRGVPRGGESDLPVPGAELRPRARVSLRERVPLAALRELQEGI